MNNCVGTTVNRGTIEEKIDELERVAAELQRSIDDIYGFIPNKNVTQASMDSEARQEYSDGLEGRLDMVIDALSRSSSCCQVICTRLGDKFGSMTIE